ncbi:EVE domain-containing protein [Azospirillum thermophilum]|uniref:EVE domain-containing protein n=1 Tax=Azospirillum thermophilum TaxID=2202148 RepID=A0A2S2CT56_9PROT|nr:EVE domain-containing protein [Azospirillum thermophilum]AWK87703.1 EVE domain-containing protein [Azospirillum thermophilum]
MAHWLVKSEPVKYSWDRMVADGVTHWDGVRNHQASNNLKAMQVGDRAFFYHSNEGLEVVGVVEVARTYYPDPSDPAGRFGMVDMRAVMPVQTPVTLKQMKADPLLQGMALVRQSRLSVCPVTDEEWARVCELAGIEA